jgi:uncharacterized lipoprotein YmbA
VRRRTLRNFACLVALALLAGCAASEPARFYTLAPQAPEPAAAPGPAPAPVREAVGAVGLSPVAVPRYLDRSQLVTRTDANTLELSEFDKWAEPLADMIGRILAEDLARRLPERRVFLLPVRQAVPIDRVVDVQIVRFDTDPAGAVALDARWQVFAGAGRSLLVARDAAIRETASGPGKSAVVAAMSRALSQLSAEITQALRAEPMAKAPRGA